MAEQLALKGGKRTVPQELKIPWPVINESDKRAVAGVLDSGTIWGIFAPQMEGLQEDFASYIGTKYCLAMNSGTACLHGAVAAAGVQPGDEVITTAFSFLASAVSVLHHNGIPVFVDIDPESYNIDINKIEEKITEKTKAIMPVHIHGLPADMDEIMAIAKKHNLIVIEDAAQAHGTFYKGRRTGSIGHMGCFSLNSTKNLPGGEGGLFTTDTEEYMARANMLRMFGEYVEPNKGRKYMAYSMGWMYRTQEMPCAFTRSQLKRLDHFNENSRQNAEYLTSELGKIKGIIPPAVPKDRTHIYHKYRIRLDRKALGINMDAKDFRTKIQNALQAEGVDAVLWQQVPIPGQPLFQILEGYGGGFPWTYEKARKIDWKKEYSLENYPVTCELLDNSLVICSELYPLYPQKRELMEHYVEAFKKVFSKLDQVLT